MHSQGGVVYCVSVRLLEDMISCCSVIRAATARLSFFYHSKMHFSSMLAAVKNGSSKNRQALINVNGITCIFSTIPGLVWERLIRALMLQSEVRWVSTEKVHCFFLLYTCLNFTKKNQYRVCWVNFPGGWSYFGQWYCGTIIDFSVIEVSGCHRITSLTSLDITEMF